MQSITRVRVTRVTPPLVFWAINFWITSNNSDDINYNQRFSNNFSNTFPNPG